MRGCFVTATGTDVGKTVFARALTHALLASGRTVAALKPIETGYESELGSDAASLAAAAGCAALAHAPGFYRAAAPLAPAAVALAGGPPVPTPAKLSEAVRAAARGYQVAVVEGAGGLLVPMDATHTVADLALALGLPLVMVAPDGLGVLSHVLTAVESATARGLRLRAVVLMTQPASSVDPSSQSNAQLLESRVGCAVHRFGRAPLDPEGLRRFAEGLSWLPGLGD